MPDSNGRQNEVVPNAQRAPAKAPWRLPVAYTVVITLLALSGLLAVLNLIDKHQSDTQSLPLSHLVILVLMAGAVGGCLFNMHSLIKHIDRGDFRKNHTIGYYLHPISGAVCGLIVVILLLGGVLTLGLGELAKQVVLQHPGKLMPFIAVAIIAGYGSRQFKKKLDELADTFFRTDDNKKARDNKENGQPAAIEGHQNDDRRGMRP